MKSFIAKNLQHLIAILLLLVFTGGYLFMEFSVFRNLEYQAPATEIDANLKARKFFHSILRGDGAFQTWLTRFRNDTPSDRIVILNIDYDLISDADSWPIPRKIIAELFSRLSTADPELVLVDAIFEWPQTPWVIDEVSRKVTAENAEALMPLLRALNHDGVLKAAMAETDYILIYFFVFTKDLVSAREQQKYVANMQQMALSSPPVDIEGEGINAVFPSARILGVRNSILPLQLHAKGQGFAWFNQGRHGSISHVPLFHRLVTVGQSPQSYFLPNIVSEAVRVVSGQEGYGLRIDSGVVESFSIGDREILTDPAGEMIVNFYNRQHKSRLPVVRAYDLIKGNVSLDIMRDKIVLLGSDTNLLNDYVQSPVGRLWGTEAIGYAVSNILNGDYFYRPRWAPLFETFQLLLVALLTAASCHLFKPVYSFLSVLVLAGIVAGINSAQLINLGQVFSLTFPMALLVLLFLQYSLIRFITEEKQKRFLKNALSLYLSPELSRQVADDPELLKLDGKEEELTVLFSDIRNFSSISETMSAEMLTAYLQRYFSPMTEIIFSTDGTLDKYIGDAIMAFWGAPLEQDDHAVRACTAALQMLARLDELALELQQDGLPKIEIGIGLHSGLMRVGNMGSEKRLNYTVLGDNVNLGSRLEGLTKFYGVRLIVSEQTWLQLNGRFYGRQLDRVRVKGKEEVVTIYEVMGEGTPDADLQEMLAGWEKGLEYFRARRWAAAEAVFSTWQHQRKDNTAAMYLGLLEKYRDNGGNIDWPPVSVMTEK